jgi:GDP-L-fucose synthase
LRIIVTGSSGFLGTHLCRAIEEQGAEVTRLTSRTHDLRDSRALDGISGEFDVIWHLAAWTQAGDFCLSHPGEQWIINQQINSTVLSWWALRQPQAKLISMGTSCAYDPGLPLKESNYLVGKPINGLYVYGMTKRMLHIGQAALNRQYGLRFLTLVPSTLYGPDYHTDGRQMHFIFDLIRKILRAKFLGDKAVLWGDGHQRRELVYVDDFVTAALELARRCDNRIVNIGAGEEFSIRRFAGDICEAVGYDFGQIGFDESRYVGATSKCLDVSRLREIYPEFSLTPLSAGLRRTIDWFVANRQLIAA